MDWIDTVATGILLGAIALFIIGFALMFSPKRKYGQLFLGIALPILGMSIVVSAVDYTEWNFFVIAFIVIGLPMIVTVTSLILFIYNNKIAHTKRTVANGR